MTQLFSKNQISIALNIIEIFGNLSRLKTVKKKLRILPAQKTSLNV